MQKRSTLRTLISGLAVGTALAASLSGCGFALRQPPHMPFRSIMLTGFAPNSPMAVELARSLEDSGVSVVETTAQAAPMAQHVVLQALVDRREQTAASITAYAQVRDMGLVTRLKFRLLRASGDVLVGPTELAVSRSLPYNEKDALARQDEYEAMHKAMQTDLAEQVMRRLAAVRP